MRSVAVDLGAKESSLCEVAGGKAVLRRTVTSLEGLKDVLGPSSSPARVAIEACREAWVVHDQLRDWGHEVLLVDTTRARQLGIGQHGRKNDRIDAETLARAVERGGIPLAHVLSPERREIRHYLGVRRALVETRAQYVATVRGLVRAHGDRVSSCDVDNFVAQLGKARLKPETRAMVAPLVELLELLTPKIAQVDAKLEALCAEEPQIARLTTAPGVGLIVAAAFVSVIDEAKRFRDAHQVASYLGLVPREDTSGGRSKQRLGAITKQGNPYLRSLLIQAAHSILRMKGDEPLRLWAQGVDKRRGRRIAVVALARRLAGVLWAMWRHGSVYEGEAAAAASARGLRLQAHSVERSAAAMKRAEKKAQERARSIRKGLAAASCPTAATKRRAAAS